MARCHFRSRTDSDGIQCAVEIPGPLQPRPHEHQFLEGPVTGRETILRPGPLFDDPRFRSPTAVPRRGPGALPWIRQAKFGSGGPMVLVGLPAEGAIHGVAVMSESDENSMLIIRIGDESTALAPRPEPLKTEFPLLYLSQLWPHHLKLRVHLLFTTEEVSLELVGVPSALVVLLGARVG